MRTDDDVYPLLPKTVRSIRSGHPQAVANHFVAMLSPHINRGRRHRRDRHSGDGRDLTVGGRGPPMTSGLWSVSFRLRSEPVIASPVGHCLDS